MVQWITLPSLSDYQQTLALMECRVQELIANTAVETIYLLEHNDVYTAGTSAKPDELFNANQIPVIYTNRGGKFTYHGKGQRVIYPVLNLALEHRCKDLRLYVRMLELWIINSLAQIGVSAFTIDSKVGIWVKHLDTYTKIAAIGIRIKKWITYHGVAVNINTDLSKFKGIIACGIQEYQPISLQALGITITFNEFDQILQQEFDKIFQVL